MRSNVVVENGREDEYMVGLVRIVWNVRVSARAYRLLGMGEQAEGL
jgi:hypothetical protein